MQSTAGNWIYLRPVEHTDLPSLHAWRSDLEHLHIWSNQRRLVTFEEFMEEMEATIRTSNVLTIVDMRSDRAIGVVQAYGMNAVDQYASILMYLEPRSWSRGYGVEAGILFTRYLFKNYGLRKIYAEVVSFNNALFRAFPRTMA
jgi:RimJ/RimL family protein N-acetyltransferase